MAVAAGAGAAATQDRPLVVVTREVPGKIDVPGAEVRMGRGDPMLSRAELLEIVRGASILVSMFHDRVDAELLDRAGPGLRGVCNFAVGYNNIDLAECRRRGIAVCNTPDAVTEGTANLTWAMILACSRRLVEADRFVRAGRFVENLPITGFLGVHLTGQTLLIVGAGRIGRAVALRALGFGMRVQYVSRSRHLEFELAPLAAERVSLEEGLPRADVVSLHCPLTPETRHLIDADRLSLMKPTSILINTARGPVVHEAALVEALRERRLYAAGLDVFEDEPRLAPGLAELDNVVLAPHIGSAEEKYRKIMTEMVSASARAILSGTEPTNRVA